MLPAMTTITRVVSRDLRYQLGAGEGTDAVHDTEEWAYATAVLETDGPLSGTGFALTMGRGNDLVCGAIDALGDVLVGREIEALMAEFGAVFHGIADHPAYRWLGPHKGVVHLALASLTNACFDLWAKSRGLPLWRLLLDLSPEAVVATLDLSYLDEVLTPAEAVAMLAEQSATRPERSDVLELGYPGYDTSVGWFDFSEAQVRDKAQAAADAGFGAVKLKVGAPDRARDVRRAMMLRETLGPDFTIMLDANQQWTLPAAIKTCTELSAMEPYWIEEPTHPDDVSAHRALADAIAPVRLAAGEHMPNRVIFKAYLQADAIHFVQPDVTRIGGVSEFISISLLAKRFGKPVVPHVGDMGQVHQHLVLFNRVAIGHEEVFLEYIPHLRDRLVTPATVADGRYRVPQEPGASSDLR
jgi:L-fuconate dehydratase